MIIIKELYSALREAGVTEETATKAAESVADIRELIHALDKRLGRLEAILSVNVIATVVGVIKMFNP
jgi:rRNA-processing protein FCF1